MSDSSDTRTRILQAAGRVFARDGLQGATTRAIATEAGVNEVTLFRQFQNKEGLLAAVMTQLVQAHNDESMGTEIEWTGNLKKNLSRFAQEMYEKLQREEPFLRTMVGEAHRRPDEFKTIIMDAVRPVRERFIANLETARQAGLIRKGLDLGIAADTFTATLFGGMLRHTAGCSWGYPAEDFIATCVDIFAAGLASQSSK